ncbi:MAG: tryptophan-rich sensory protein [Propionibacteriaceae bacterium]|jgi:tryptophan-rich sensory protein|nr:tryptophan-rich sensory protein [Propionibacteriaceae bacterium]
MKKELRFVLTFLGLLVLTEGIGALSAYLAGDIKGKYLALELPPLSPPTWVFGIAWPLLYALMALSLTLYIGCGVNRRRKQVGISLFTIQLFLNFLWSIIFFAGGLYWVGLVVIILLDLAVAALVIIVRPHSLWASRLLLPYLVWLLFATYLTVGVAAYN